MFNDPIADLLTRLRNAKTAGLKSIVMPHSKLKEQVAKILKSNRFVTDVAVAKDGSFKSLSITLSDDPDAITSLIRISKPGRRVYTTAKNIPLVLGGRGMVIVSTSGGIMSGRDARKAGLGGELICKVW
ncbi:30S ribosomal protein S8 [bacterium]|jgi:small subunit ribosomal protein S8|nr:MAG: 30S ribosomal protein S8 [bacterium]